MPINHSSRRHRNQGQESRSQIGQSERTKVTSIFPSYLYLLPIWFLVSGFWFLQASAQQPALPADATFLQAIITGPPDVAVGRTIVLDASSSRTFGQPVEYQWFIVGTRQPISRTVEAVYTPEKPGSITFRLVVTLKREGSAFTSEALHTITVYNRKIVLIADSSIPAEKLTLHQQTAADAGVFLRLLQSPGAATAIGAEEELTELLVEQSAALGGANAIVVWTEGVSGLQALMRAVQNKPELRAGVQNQTIVLVTDTGLSTAARTARGPYAMLSPQQILVTRKEAIPLLLTAESTEEFLLFVAQRDIDYLRVDATTAGLRPWNVLSFLVNAMLVRGVPTQTVILLLVLPVIATILAFVKQVIGITTFGLYTPSIVALSFLSLGWFIGVVFLFCILVAGYATRAVMSRWRLLYIPKVAIILTVVSLTLLVLIGTGAFFGISFSRETVFILLVMSTLAESFLTLKTEEGWYAALLGVGETVTVALLCVFLVQWSAFQALLLAYPELIFLTIILNAFLGRWTGLRLVEYFRFREVFRHLQEE